GGGSRRSVMTRIEFQGQSEPEGAAFAEGAADTDRAPHQLGELLGNRQAQSGASILPGGGTIGLAKFLKERPNLLRWNATACILHRDSHVGREFVTALALDVDQYLTVRRELHCIAHEVGQHLADSSGISNEVAWQMGRVLENQIEVLVLSFGGQHFTDIFHYQT